MWSYCYNNKQEISANQNAPTAHNIYVWEGYGGARNFLLQHYKHTSRHDGRVFENVFIMAAPMDVRADEFRQIFGDSDEEDVGEEGFQVGDESDLEIDGYSSEEESESEDGDSDVEEESEWSEVLEDFDVEAFDTALSGIKVEIPD